MTLKKFDLEKGIGKKLERRRKGTAIPSRFASESASLPDRRERRRQDAAAGLVPFACKLPSDLVERLRARSLEHPAGLSGLITDLLYKSMER